MTIDAPAALPDRIATLDIIRGVAVMGILLMNIVAFAMPEAAYSNPRRLWRAAGVDLAVWAFNFVLFDGKMRGLFSFLFGASMLLVIERATAKGENPARVHFRGWSGCSCSARRICILLWWGDILDALCAGRLHRLRVSHGCRRASWSRSAILLSCSRSCWWRGCRWTSIA